MYHSEQPYINRVRMRREWNKFLFVLYCIVLIIVNVLLEVIKVVPGCAMPISYSIIQLK